MVFGQNGAGPVSDTFERWHKRISDRPLEEQIAGDEINDLELTSLGSCLNYLRVL